MAEFGKKRPGGCICRECGGSGECGPRPPCYGSGWSDTWGGDFKPKDFLKRHGDLAVNKMTGAMIDALANS